MIADSRRQQEDIAEASFASTCARRQQTQPNRVGDSLHTTLLHSISLLFVISSVAGTDTTVKMSDNSKAQEKAQEVLEQQSDNMAHAVAGAGGGLLSMALTFVIAHRSE